MTHKDPTLDGAVWLEHKEKFRNMTGCGSCQHREFKGWGSWSCKFGNTVNKKGFCRMWSFNEGVK